METVQRRTANYKPNIWNYDQIQSLTTKYQEEKYVGEAEILKEKVCGILVGLRWDPHPVRKLELIDWINKLALSHYFDEQISESLNEAAAAPIKTLPSSDPYSTAFYFRILRQNGYHVSQDAIVQLLDDQENTNLDEKAIVEIFEASHLALEDEYLSDRAKILNSKEKLPLQWSVSWYNAKNYIRSADESILHRLAGLSYNMIQVQHQNELKEILRWWRSLDLLQVLTFTRDRVVESFLWAAGVAYEPQYRNLRKWLTKAILLVTTHSIDVEVQKEKGCSSVLPLLKKVWTGFCKALFVEAKWYHTGESPSLEEYLENGWVSSSGVGK